MLLTKYKRLFRKEPEFQNSDLPTDGGVTAGVDCRVAADQANKEKVGLGVALDPAVKHEFRGGRRSLGRKRFECGQIVFRDHDPNICELAFFVRIRLPDG